MNSYTCNSNNHMNIIPNDLKKEESTTCEQCNKLHELLRHNKKNRRKFYVGKRVRQVYLLSGGYLISIALFA